MTLSKGELLSGSDVCCVACRVMWSSTFAEGLRVVPVRVSCVDALDDGRPLLQRVPGVTGELHHRPHAVSRVSRAEVSILDVRLVAVALLKC